MSFLLATFFNKERKTCNIIFERLIPSNEGIKSVERDQNAFCTLYRSICIIKILSQIYIILRADKQTMEVVWTQHHSSLDLNELHQACMI